MDYNRICINCMKEKGEGENVCRHCGFNPSVYKTAPYVLPPFTILRGKYLIGKMLGAGGFGITYLAFDMVLEHRVAVKEFFVNGIMYRDSERTSDVTISSSGYADSKTHASNLRRFSEEARTMAQLEDMPGIVRVHDFFEENGTAYIVMEYLSGQTLKEYVRSHGGKLSWDETIQTLTPVMKSLQELHSKGIIHRDISPDNLMFKKPGDIRLLDFGGAKQQIHDQDHQHSSVILSKKGYSPIEQISTEGKQGPWTDVYALAATIYYCLCGKPPLDAIERMAGTGFTSPRAAGADISAQKEKVLMKGLALKASDRYPSMEEFLTDLQRSSSSGSGAVPGTGKNIVPVPNAHGKNKLPFILGGVGAAAAACALLVFILGRGSGDTHTLTIEDGTGGGSYEAGELVTITARETEEGEHFVRWKVESGHASVEERTESTTSLIIPQEDVTLVAVFESDTEGGGSDSGSSSGDKQDTGADAGGEQSTDAAKDDKQNTDTAKDDKQNTDAAKDDEGSTDASTGTEENSGTSFWDQNTSFPSGDEQSTDASSGDEQSTDASSGDEQSTDASSGDEQSTDASSGDEQETDSQEDESETEEAGQTWHLDRSETYDADGVMTSWTEYSYNEDGSGAGSITYDADGNQTDQSVYYYRSDGTLSRSVSDSESSHWESYFDSTGEHSIMSTYIYTYSDGEKDVSTYMYKEEYDDEEHLIKRTATDENGEIQYVNTYTYRNGKRVTGTSQYYYEGEVSSSYVSIYNSHEDEIRSDGYDEKGNLTGHSEYTYTYNDDDRTTSYTYLSYDENGAVEEEWSNSYEYEYDEHGNMISSTRYNYDGSLDSKTIRYISMVE